jgi:hypothetical protein
MAISMEDLDRRLADVETILVEAIGHEGVLEPIQLQTKVRAEREKTVPAALPALEDRIERLRLAVGRLQQR